MNNLLTFLNTLWLLPYVMIVCIIAWVMYSYEASRGIYDDEVEVRLYA